MKDIHKNLESITKVALHFAKEHNCNYNIILMNPFNGKFDEKQSTYEFVIDSYFDKPRPNSILIKKTDDLLKKDNFVSEETAFSITGRGTVGKGNNYLDFCNPNDVEIINEANKYTKNWKTPFVRTEPKVQRNAICSCGSGKKNKNCCKL